MIFKPSKHNRPQFGKLANEYSLTYYGTVDPARSPDYEPLRGITAAPDQIDDNYVVGVVSGVGVAMLQRTHDVYTKESGNMRKSWVICNAKCTPNIPRALLTEKNNRDSFIDDLSLYLRMYSVDLNELPVIITDDFINKFSLFIAQRDIDQFSRILTPELQAMLSVHFSNMDYEFDGNNIYTYLHTDNPELVDLDKQLRITVWLAQQLDKIDNTNSYAINIEDE